jgi:OmpA family
MASTLRIHAKLLLRLAVPLLFATALSACSSIPDWVDPTTWIGGGSQASSDQTGDASAGTAQQPASGQDASSAQPAAGDKTPDIANIPPKPAPPSTADEQKQVADSLAADRSQANYSADALRGGTEAVAAPPPPPASPSSAAPDTGSASPQSTEATSPTPPAADETATTGSADNATSVGSPAVSTSSAAPAPADAPTPTAEQAGAAAPPPADNSALMAGTAAPASAGETQQAASPAPAAPANQVASTDAASASAPAAAPMAPEAGAAAMAPAPQGAPDMQTTFAPSKAPALDPSVAQFVPQQILSRYQETAAAASAPGVSSAAVSPKHRHHKKAKTSQMIRHHRHLASLFNHDRRRHRRLAFSDRPSMTPRVHSASAVHAEPNLMAASYSPAGALDRKAMAHGTMASTSYGIDPAVFAPVEQAAVAVVDFPRETTILDASARGRVRSAARSFAAHGGNGYVRVVGRSSVPVPELSRSARLEYNFQSSEAQATAVARELIRDGVPAQRVLVEAVGDNPPADPDATRGSRSAEIFLQS